MEQKINGIVYVLGDNIDTDQIIPANYLTFNPAIEEERRQFGRYALSGVPDQQAGLPQGNTPFVDLSHQQTTTSKYCIIIAGRNFIAQLSKLLGISKYRLRCYFSGNKDNFKITEG